tara:strand:- start:132 stop:1322 length:1191 start_codon:yes stop_codon:yes gene_type:complete
MGIFSFLRKKKVEEPEVEIEEITFDEVGGWLDEKRKGLREREKEVFVLIDERIDLFVREIDGKIKVLEGIDIESKKVEDRARIIVRQGLDKYLDYVGIFMKELADVEKNTLRGFIQGVNKVFSSFEKHSYIFYQRATFLVGDEILAVKQEIVGLSGDFTKLFNEKQKLLNSLDVISAANSKLKKLDEIDKTLDKIDLEMKEIGEKVNAGREKVEKTLREIEEIKGGKDYAERGELLREIELGEGRLEGDVLKLKVLVDFKMLSNVFHSDEKKMKLVKSYKEDFSGGIARDGGESLLNLIKEAEAIEKKGLGSGTFGGKINEIEEMKKSLIEDKKLVKKDEVAELLGEVERIKAGIESLSIEKVKHRKRIEVVKERKEEIFGEIKQGVLELNGRIVE